MSQNLINLNVGAEASGRSLSNFTFSCDKSFVSSNGNTVNVDAYYVNTQIILTPASGLKLTLNSSANNSAGGAQFVCTQDSPGANQISIGVTNNQNSQNATYSNGVKQEYLFTLEDSSGCQGGITCWVTAVPCTVVTVHFDPSASPSFTYPSGIVIDPTGKTPPTVTAYRDQGVKFTLDDDSVSRGIAFCTAPVDPDDPNDDGPFVWDPGPKDNCITDIATDGTSAVITDLYKDPTETGTSHGFKIRVKDEGGNIYTSPDPTVVNVEPPPG